mgnify:CR=1 FL=1
MARSLLQRLALAACLSISGGLIITPLAMAQEVDDRPTVNPDEGFTSPDGGDNFLESPTGAFDLIHQSVLRNETSREEFRLEQQERISGEAASFRELQQQQIRERNSTGE